jgi:methyltransferase (TIGR00027 family)
MDQGQRSRTAEAAAACRAWHFLYSDAQMVFEDPFALELTSPIWRVILKSPAISWLTTKLVLRRIFPIFAEILGRSRYTEDQLEKAIANGVDQYVLLGAGMDSFALRRKDLSQTIKVYELDHPASQMAKRRRLAELGRDLPTNLEFVPVDFEKETVTDGLVRSSYSAERPTFFSWIGVVAYLTRDAIFRTLESIRSFSAPGSELIIDYVISKELLGANELRTVEAVERFVARRGEPFVSYFDPIAFLSDVCSLGYEVLEHLSPKELEARYFAGRRDGLRPIENVWYTHLRL